eukprot:Gb_19441 [translate_table: standard]
MERRGVVLVALLWSLLQLLPRVVKGSPPPPPVKCSSGLTNCIVSNAYGTFPDRTTCRAAAAVFPSNEKEVVEFVGMAVQKKQKMRVATRWSHSIPKLVCPGGDSGLIISTRDLNHVIGIDMVSMRITVESGVSLRELIDAAAKQGLALPHSPYWEGITVGGLLSTGAHGSSLFDRGSAVHDYVVGMRLVIPGNQHENYTRIKVLTEAEEDLNAAKVSLGLLGVISHVTLQLQPMFKRSIVNLIKDHSALEKDIVGFGRKHEFGDLTWYPSQQKVVYRIDDRVSVNVSGNGVNDFIGFRPISTMLLGTVRMAVGGIHHMINECSSENLFYYYVGVAMCGEIKSELMYGEFVPEEAQEVSVDAVGKCACAEVQMTTMLGSGWGLKNRGLVFNGYPVVGYQNMVQASGSCLYGPQDALLTACPWDPRVKGEFFHQIAVAIGLSKIIEFVTDIKRLQQLNPSSLCGVELYNGILMRFVKGSSAYLGAEQDSVVMDITFYRANDPDSPRLNEDVLEEIEQMGLYKYGGTPHWGKNRNLAFDGVMGKYAKSDEFMRAKYRYDPDGLFSSEWTDGLLGIGNQTVVVDKNGCALEGLCICRVDTHCAPHKGYFCRSGRVFTDARVCRYEG